MTMVAVIPVANLSAARATLLAAGFGPENFSVPAYGNGSPTHTVLHSWAHPAFEAAVQALPGVSVNIGTGDPTARTAALIAAAGAQWGDNAPLLPTSGNTVANTLYRFPVSGTADELWWCIQVFNRTTFPLAPGNYPALIRRSRRPGEVLPWAQPLDQFDAYQLANPFTGQPDRVTHSGKTWDCLIANNTNQPGVANWREYVEGGYPAWLQPTGAGDAYPVGFLVSHLGQNWRNTSPANTFAPGVFGWVVEP
jgi:hypothetical protein